MDEEKLAAAFAEWIRQWQADPDAFMTVDEAIALPIDDYGHRSARTLLRILEEIG